MKPYQLDPQDLFSQTGSSETGLSASEAALRLQHFGPNELQEQAKLPMWRLLLQQFNDFMILILVGAAILSGLMGDMVDTIIILVIVSLNAIIGFLQEYRAEKAMAALKSMSITQTQVLRDGQSLLISSLDLVPGDVVILEAGNIVPADLRLLQAHNLRIDESSLTGESVPVDKQASSLSQDNIGLGDQVNMAFKGSLVSHGRGIGLVIATGMGTELGRIANLLQEQDGQTPLQQRMAEFGKKLSHLILLICLIFLVSGLLRGENPYQIILLAISLAVAAIPEALPALITVALSRGASLLAAQNALVRKLPAVETLGSVTFICTDKTGTLTQNKMKVISQQAFEPHFLQLGMALNHDIKFNDKGEPFGEATELALVQAVLTEIPLEHYLKIQSTHERLAELPFDSDRKCMTTVHHYQGQYLIITKGASEAIAATLANPQEQQQLQEQSEIWGKEGKRVLAYAYRVVDQLPQPFTYTSVEQGLKLAGLVALMDPPRPEVKAAIAEAKMAGIKPVMITGDHPATAKAIASEIGILSEGDLVLTGAALQHLDEASFKAQVEQVAVYARVSPDQKLRIVRTLQQKGHFAAMTGDGVNDAPSLKAADIGLAMGINGTDVSKEASDVVLLDDNFATIVKAVKEGRRIFDNIRKFVKYIMTCNGAEIWIIFLAPLLTMPNPLLPVHILWINLVTDGIPALSLANEQAEDDIMQRPPRPSNESLFSDGVAYHIIWVGLLMAGITLGTQAWCLYQGIEHWQTMVFSVLALCQLAHVMAVRSDHTFLYKQGIWTNLPLIGSVLLTLALQMAIIYLPFLNEIFNTQPLSFGELAFCFGGAALLFHAVELEKWFRLRRK